MTILLLTFFPVLFLILAHFKWPDKVTLPEIIAGFAISLILAGGMYQAGRFSQLHATELWNGEITGTDKDVTRYTESYDCRCRTVYRGTGDNRRAVRECDTCYRHGYNLRWDALSNIGSFRIQSNRCTTDNRRICTARYPDPQRWLDIEIGDPVSRTNSYINYVRAANSSLFNTGGATPNRAGIVIENTPLDMVYPIQVYDHYRVDRVLLDEVSLPAGQSLDWWNEELSQILRTLGPEKQANMVVVLTTNSASDYADHLMTHWQGANKNDIVIVAGFPDGTVNGSPAWVRVHSWAKEDIMNVTMRDELLDNPQWWATPSDLFPNIQAVVMEHFERRPMAEFEYLANEIEPTTSQVIMFTILSILAGIGMVWVFLTYDVFGNLFNSRRRRF